MPGSHTGSAPGSCLDLSFTDSSQRRSHRAGQLLGGAIDIITQSYRDVAFEGAFKVKGGLAIVDEPVRGIRPPTRLRRTKPPTEPAARRRVLGRR